MSKQEFILLKNEEPLPRVIIFLAKGPVLPRTYKSYIDQESGLETYAIDLMRVTLEEGPTGKIFPELTVSQKEIEEALNFLSNQNALVPEVAKKNISILHTFAAHKGK